MLLGQKPCPDCEPAQVNHRVLFYSACLGLVVKPLFRPLNSLFRIVFSPFSASSFDVVGPLVLRLLAFLHIGNMQSEIADDDSDRTRALWTEAHIRGIHMVEYRLGPIKDLFIARCGGQTRCFDGLPRPRGGESASLYWMDNKAEMRKRFAEAGIPVARGGARLFRNQALALFRTLDKPVITKPYTGSRSRHTTIHLQTESQFIAAWKKARQLSPLVLIEEELSGFVFRGTLIGGTLTAVMRREPPGVWGDGVHTVLELVEEENKNPKRHGKTFHLIAMGPDADEELKRQGLSLGDIPEEGRFVSLNQKVSRGIGAGTTDVTDSMHPENRKLLERVGALLNDPLVGVDFIMQDVSVPWQMQKKSGVIECNSLPFIDLHHYPLRGASRNVAGTLWDIIFPDSAQAKTKLHIGSLN
ncbi:MAG: hypothetical protein Q7R88_02685 [bacterium]|nr:hypothetical protein [bacterium]